MVPGVLQDLKIASRVFQKRGLPVNLIFFVTSRCNLTCTHCFYWKKLNQKIKELELDEIQLLSRSLPNLLSLSLTGGEPYLRPDLPEIAFAFERNSQVRNIQIPSNGLLVDQTLRLLEELLRKVHRARVCTGVSLDGPEEIHNRIRRNNKSFASAIETLRGMQKLQTSFPNLRVGVALTVSSANQDRLDDLHRFVAEELKPDGITITLVRGKPLDPTLKEVDLRIYHEFSRRIITDRKSHPLKGGWTDRLVIAKEEETYRLISEAAQSDRRVSPCYGGELVAVLSETGEVYPCETLNISMGNIRQFHCDFGLLWKADQAAQARTYQKRLGCQCTYECAMSVNTLFNSTRLIRIIKNSFLWPTVGKG
jgi:sulfatase maturation enzyme AslB (radical SAM superfamily)